MLEGVAPTSAAGLPATTEAQAAEAASSARAAGLRYVTDDSPGIHRRGGAGHGGAAGRTGRSKGFVYFDAQGRRLRDAAQLARITALAIPPAWTSVWICPLPNGHLQATGRDARGRKQYRYHAEWRAVRDATKFGRMVAFGEALPRLRARVGRDLALAGLPREKVLAAVVRLLETTLIRIGNEEYARQNRSFGLTTLRNRHVEIDGAELRFNFRGKSGKEHSVMVADRRLARVVRACRDLPGHELFQYLDDSDTRQSVSSEDVNGYLREATGEELSAKDFRTWGGTVLALSALSAIGCATSAAEADRCVAAAVKLVAEQLGNRPAICRKYYVHPAVLEAFAGGRLAEVLAHGAAAAAEPPPLAGPNDAEGQPATAAERLDAAAASAAAAVEEAVSATALPAAGLRGLEKQALALLRSLPVGEPPRRRRRRSPVSKGTIKKCRR
jgi:DNA topoisomerase-1